MTLVKFSIVIPLYNKEKYISRAINSVLKQEFIDWELIVVDDGSTDNSFNVANTIKDSRIKLMRKENGGESSARNFGMIHSNGDFICFLDADDEWLPNFLDTVQTYILKYPSVSFFAPSYKTVSENGLEKEPCSLGESIDCILLDLSYLKKASESTIVTSNTAVIKRDIFKVLGGFVLNLKRSADREYWLRIILSGYKLCFINTICAVYHLEAEDRVCNTLNIDYREDLIFQHKALCQKFNVDRKKDVDLLYEYLCKFAINRSVEFLRGGDLTSAQLLLREAKRTKVFQIKYLKAKMFFLYLKVNSLTRNK